ncbi:hypothetical protein CYMTET_14362 [Cymbomonas tetramitiformis]|uniref:EGF-like domain-containing protein n=1 Tax=Cymbomonas tetramitiformis TaxID=36881 RepID=A0AAE0GGR5_9CHLO|nr:hypothetical protein CYMTET_14362 [Cymbomonas tetramitiformis]
MSEISNHSETVADLQGRIALLAEKDDRKAAAIREISERSAILSNYSDIVADLKERVVLLNEKVEKQAAEIPDLFIKSVGSSLKETTKTNTFTHKKNRPATTDAGLPVAEVSADVWSELPKGCPGNCSQHGFCNPELNRCICLPGRGGPDCGVHLAPACVTPWDPAGHCPQPYVDTAAQAYPCACIAQCHAAGLDVVAARHKVWTSLSQLSRSTFLSA